MASARRRHALRGLGRLAVDGTVALADVVEAMHSEIVAPLGLLRRAGRTRGITGLVYRNVRGAARLAGAAYEAAVDRLDLGAGGGAPSARGEAALAILNGVIGDHLAATQNPLAIQMELRRDGQALELETGALAEAIPRSRRRVVVLVHGSCMNELAWTREGHDYGAALERDLEVTTLYLRYNTGLHISTNGQRLAEMFERLADVWPSPLDGITLLGHSMGGLVARSACHYGAAAGLRWPALLDACFFLGTPHLGAPLERGGHGLHAMLRVSRYSAPLTALAAIRSAGVTDLRHGSVVDEDWKGRDRFATGARRTTPVPLPHGVRCFAIAGSTSRAGALVGDGLVSLRSALGRHRDSRRALVFTEERCFVARGVGHVRLLADPGVYRFVEQSLAEAIREKDAGTRRTRVHAGRPHGD